MLRIEATTVSIGYSDFLLETAPLMRHLFHKWVIVTTPADEETREVAKRQNLDVLLTEDDKRDGEFSKGRMIQRGLMQLSSNSWWLHIDADTVLPADLHNRLDGARLDEGNLYSWDRITINGWDNWQKLKQSGYLNSQLDYHYRMHWPESVPYKMGSRWVHPREGWCPIGMSQLTHASASEWNGIRQRPYPYDHSACRTDIQYSFLWDRHRRVFLPEIVAVHLESEPCPLGANWLGRKTKRFGPPVAIPIGPSSPSCG